MEQNIELENVRDLYCVNCNRWTRQKHIGILADGSQLFLCKDCGCENTIEKHERDEIQV